MSLYVLCVSFIGFSKGGNTDQNALKESRNMQMQWNQNVLHHIFVELLGSDSSWPSSALRLPSEECFELLNTRRFPGGFFNEPDKNFQVFVPWIGSHSKNWEDSWPTWLYNVKSETYRRNWWLGLWRVSYCVFKDNFCHASHLNPVSWQPMSRRDTAFFSFFFFS